jgi:hypothetical protein
LEATHVCSTGEGSGLASFMAENTGHVQTL